MPNLEQDWISYSLRVMPSMALEVQRNETRRAFYAGAASMFALVVQAAALPEDAACDRMDEIRRELDAFNDRVKRGEA